ncbi:hypothetical protein TruAng_011931 [Truncatella angustata]|nr:hypothetical protein TruAng_011931 [Truncatella angustata]
MTSYCSAFLKEHKSHDRGVGQLHAVRLKESSRDELVFERELLEESEVVPKIDALIVATAIWAETLYQKRPEIKKEKNRDGSPTPAPDINAISDVNMTG